jgi:2'-5' RNA ligase
MNRQVPEITLPGYQLYEYRIQLLPHADLADRIAALKKQFNQQYKLLPATGKPNLPLATFSAYRMMEERIIHRLQQIALGYPAFKVELKDFGSFPSHTIYINVTSRIPVQQLVKTIRSESQRLMFISEEIKPHFILEPHITLGTKLKHWQYEKGWLEYSNTHFTGRFIADSMYLSRRESKDMPWQLIRRFEFCNMPVSIKQGELFG